MIPIRQASLEFEEFLTANEYDLGNSADTVAFYRKKIKPLLAWAERERKAELNAQTLREFFRDLKTNGLTDNGRHAYYRAIRTWLNFLVRRKVIRDNPLKDADIHLKPKRERVTVPKGGDFHRPGCPLWSSHPHYCNWHDLLLGRGPPEGLQPHD